MKLYGVLLVFFAVPLSHIHAGEFEKKDQGSVPLKKSVSCPLNLRATSAKLVWDISQQSIDEPYQWPFCKPEINDCLKGFQDTCFIEMQKLYTQWEESRQALSEKSRQHDILVQGLPINDPASMLSVQFLWSARTHQDIRWNVYNKIATVYQLLCRHDTPSKTIDNVFLTIQQFPDLRRSLITPMLPKQLEQPIPRCTLRKSRSTGT